MYFEEEEDNKTGGQTVYIHNDYKIFLLVSGQVHWHQSEGKVRPVLTISMK